MFVLFFDLEAVLKGFLGNLLIYGETADQVNRVLKIYVDLVWAGD